MAQRQSDYCSFEDIVMPNWSDNPSAGETALRYDHDRWNIKSMTHNGSRYN